MARKDLLKSLIDQNTDATAPDSPAQAPDPQNASPAPSRRNTGAVGAISASLNDLRSNALVEIDTALISEDGLQDRLETDPTEDAALAASITEYGQQVPILVRPDLDNDGHYKIVYGRRRLRALKSLGQKAKAIIRDLDDRDALMAQGQENSARRNLSFIEKAFFAKKMVDEGYDRKVICDALAIDKTVVSRMLAVVDGVPEQWVLAIGSAPAAGRNRWQELVGLIADLGAGGDALDFKHKTEDSDARFNRTIDHLREEKKAFETGRAQSTKATRDQGSLLGDNGEPLGALKQTPRKTSFEFYRKSSDGFDDWLRNELPRLHREFKGDKG